MELSMNRFEEYVLLMAQSLGHADRVEPFRGYCTGLMLPVKRKSVEPMAAHPSASLCGRCTVVGSGGTGFGAPLRT